MTLDAWLVANRVTLAEFAARCGVHPVTVSKWRHGRLTPRPAQMAAVLTATGGQVTANDFVVRPSGLAETQAGFPAEAPLAAEARALGLDPDAIAEAALREAVRAEKARRWLEENREAIEAHNRWVEKNELPLARYRMF